MSAATLPRSRRSRSVRATAEPQNSQTTTSEDPSLNETGATQEGQFPVVRIIVRSLPVLGIGVLLPPIPLRLVVPHEYLVVQSVDLAFEGAYVWREGKHRREG